MPPKLTKIGYAGRSSARNSPRPVEEALVHGRQEPWARKVAREDLHVGPRAVTGLGHVDQQTLDDAATDPGVAGPALPRSARLRDAATPPPSLSTTTSPFSARCSASASRSMRLPARTSISWSSGSPTTNLRARPHRDRDLQQRELERETAFRRRDLALAGNRVLHAASARSRGARPIIAVEPTRDRVAAEVDAGRRRRNGPAARSRRRKTRVQPVDRSGPPTRAASRARSRAPRSAA